MKKLLFVLMALVAMFVIAYWSIGDINYDVDRFLIHTFDKGDGVYCTPFRCVDLIHSYGDLYHLSMEYAETYGPYDPYRPRLVYSYDSYFNAYVKYFK